MRSTTASLVFLLVAACGGAGSASSGPGAGGSGGGGGGDGGGSGGASAEGGHGGSDGEGGSGGAGGEGGTGGGDPVEPGWVIAHREDFEAIDLGSPRWSPDTYPDDGPHSDDGVYFHQQGISPPPAFRISQPLGDGFITAESYSRSDRTRFDELLRVVEDPADPGNRVLRLASPEHTDATVIRSTEPLPARYRISLRVGFPDFGEGREGENGYDRGDETAGPWRSDPAVDHNGYYWLSILDSMPRPHNNTWIHHHRKLVIDSCNHYPPWMEIFDGEGFERSGERPIMLFALDGTSTPTARGGQAFLSYADGRWQPSGSIRAVDRYLPGEWYELTVERFDTVFTVEISGRFEHGGETTYRATIDAQEHCVWHFNRGDGEDASHCVSGARYPGLPEGHELWPAGESWPDWFFLGDPHSNYYEGSVLYDDVTLEVWRDAGHAGLP